MQSEYDGDDCEETVDQRSITSVSGCDRDVVEECTCVEEDLSFVLEDSDCEQKIQIFCPFLLSMHLFSCVFSLFGIPFCATWRSLQRLSCHLLEMRPQKISVKPWRPV